MNSSMLIQTFAEYAKEKNIDRPTMIRILEDVFRTMIKKRFGSDQNFDVIINVDKGDLEILRNRQIVADGEDFDEYTQVPLKIARKTQSDYEVGEEMSESVEIEDFGRRMVQTAKQTLLQKIKDVEKDALFQKYKDQVGDLIVGEVYQVLSKEVIIADGERKELSLPKSEMIPGDFFRKGEQVKAVIHRVEMTNNNPKVLLSRTSPVFLERLFEGEVPEVFDGIITIKKIVREPGERAKVAVESFDDRIDPVGACVGVKGARVNNIVRELRKENIDVINYTENLELYIQRALSPAKINNIKIDRDKRRVSVFLDRDEVSRAIGKNGQNIRLASRLVDMEIDVYRDVKEYEEYEEDVELEQFLDEIDTWVIEELKRIGLDTAKSVLNLNKEELLRRTDLEEETVDYLIETLKKEFE